MQINELAEFKFNRYVKDFVRSFISMEKRYEECDVSCDIESFFEVDCSHHGYYDECSYKESPDNFN